VDKSKNGLTALARPTHPQSLIFYDVCFEDRSVEIEAAFEHLSSGKEGLP
jgi:hypothetical protein